MLPAVSRIQCTYSTNAFCLEEFMIHIDKEVQEVKFDTCKHHKRPKMWKTQTMTNGIFYNEIETLLYSFTFLYEALSAHCNLYSFCNFRAYCMLCSAAPLCAAHYRSFHLACSGLRNIACEGILQPNNNTDIRVSIVNVNTRFVREWSVCSRAKDWILVYVRVCLFWKIYQMLFSQIMPLHSLIYYRIK